MRKYKTTLPRLRQKLHQLRSETKGVAALEFAIVAPIFITILTFGIETSYQSAVRIVLESTLSNAARESITGNIAAEMRALNLTREEVLRKRVRDKLSLFSTIKLSNLAADANPTFRLIPTSSLRRGGGFSNIGDGEPLQDLNANNVCDNGAQPDPGDPTKTVRETFSDVNGNGAYDDGNSSVGLGGPGDIVQYQIQLKSPLFFDVLKPFFKNKDDVMMTSTLVLQNESFAAASTNSANRRYCDGSIVS
jgi:Flp pilus assembly protein TadG